MTAGSRYAFGGFEIDAAARRVTRDGEPVVLANRHLDVLLELVGRAGTTVSKDALIEAAWSGIAVTDNSLEQAISALRRALGSGGSGESYIQTIPRQGYRFAAPVTRLPARLSDLSLDALLAPHRAWIEGRAALETLERSHILHAREVFERVLDGVPDQAAAHIGLANACIMQFEMTRADRTPDVDSRTLAERHAREACRLEPESGEAWATLGFVLDRTGQPVDALAATRRAVMLEPDNWRHHFRRALVGWGEERLRSAHRTLALLPGFSLAHYLAATVHVARNVMEDAERELAAGLETSARNAGANRFSAVALHWLSGLVAFALGDDDRAIAQLEKELAAEGSGHLYARECSANAWYAIGAIRIKQSAHREARAAFEQATTRVPGHPMATLGLALETGLLADVPPGALSRALGVADRRLSAVDQAIVAAAHATLAGVPLAGVSAVGEALAATHPGQSGWLIPVEPLLRVSTRADLWAPVLTHLRARAA
jgi:DNA-binding winged helix-turn-helix (wHTH) protein